MVWVGAASLLPGSMLHHSLNLNSDGQHGVLGHHLPLLPHPWPLFEAANCQAQAGDRPGVKRRENQAASAPVDPDPGLRLLHAAHDQRGHRLPQTPGH